MKIYLATSWRNPYYASTLDALKAAGHDVYEMTAPRIECHLCSRPATCFGRCDNMDYSAPSCDEHCSHGCEDGSCEPIEDVPQAALRGWAEGDAK